jgi:hypothetical protein
MGDEVTAMDEPSAIVAAAREKGVVFVLDPERSLFTLEWRGPDDRLIEEEIRDDYEEILAWLIREAEGAEAIVGSILPELADTAAVDWAQPLAAWSRDQMINFLLLAWRLIGEAERAPDESKIPKPATFDEETGDPIPF